MPTARDVVLSHLAAFNAGDRARLLALFTADATWATGQDVMTGRAALADLFDEALWALQPSLTTMLLVADDRWVAAQLHERLTVDGEVREFDIAAFFEVEAGLIRQVKVYREGSADLG